MTHAPYTINNVQEGNPQFAGKVCPDGAWIIERTTSGVLEFANVSNNLGQTNGYGAAWGNRAQLNYGPFSSLNNV